MKHAHRSALALMLASGFASLGYQIVWTQQATLWLGHETAAVLAVVAAFFGGLALGALALGRRIARSAHPARWYAACEALIALWGTALAFGVTPASAALLAITGPEPGATWQWTVAFAGTFVLLLPATAAMGATLPAMERTLAVLHGPRSTVALLYAGNTAGAVAGVLAAAFWLVPALGLVNTALACAALNLLCALAAWRLLPQAAPPTPAPATAARALGLRLAATGLLGIGYEVLAVRALSQVAENTVYTFAMLLAVYLVGTALGAAAWSGWGERAGDDARKTDRLLQALALACALGALGLWGAPSLKATLQAALGGGLVPALVVEATLAAAAFGLPTLVMGALFSHLARQALAAGWPLGRALGINTLGAAAAPALFGVALVPLAGLKAALLGLAAGYLLLASRRAWATVPHGAAAGLLAALAIWAPPLAVVDIPDGGRLVHYEEGATASVSVVEDVDGVARLRIDNRQQEGSSASRPADARQALIPLLLHPAPQRALFLGLGTGVTAGAAADDPRLSVQAVELLPEVVRASALFNGGTPHPRLAVTSADARRFVRAGHERWDVIVSDNFHPARRGSGALYTVEHFQAVRARLASGGLFCQWLPLHQLDLATLQSIVKSFLAVYPQGAAVLATHSLQTPVLGLVAFADDSAFAVDAVRARLAQAGPAATTIGLVDEWSVLGSLLAGPQALARWAADAPLNTDDRPVVSHAAPRITYAPDSSPADRLMALLQALPADGTAGLVAGAPGDRARAGRYIAARNRFLQVGVGVRPVADVQRMLAQVREPLLGVLAISPDFAPAAEPLQRMAAALAHTDAQAAGALQAELVALRPALSTPRHESSR